MTFETLQKEHILAMKNNNKKLKQVLSNMIDACQKASITSKGRVELTENLVNETLIKYQKTVQEMIDTCPADRINLLEEYNSEMEIIKNYVPQLITDPLKIKNEILTVLYGFDIEFKKKNRGEIMKILTPYFKGKADMKIVSQVVVEILE